MSDSTKDFEDELNIRLLYIPVSATDVYQPLDKYIFGILKFQTSSRIDGKSFEFQIALTKSEVADLFVSLWNNLHIRNVLKARNTALQADETSSNSSDNEKKQIKETTKTEFSDEDNVQIYIIIL